MIAKPPQAEMPKTAEVPLRPGAAMRLGKNALGMWLDAPSGGGDFRHPWLVTVGGAGVRVGKGYVIAEVAVEPLIGKVPISGDEKNTVPVLKVDAGAVNSAGETWVCVQVTPDADGKLGEKAEVKVLQSAFPFVTKGKAGRAPLALLVRRRETWQVFQIAHFHLRYVTSLSTDAGAERSHFFL